MSKTKQVEATKPPIKISPGALRTLNERVRLWSGWNNGVLSFGDPKSAPAVCNHETKTITVNPEPLLLNPNRVLLTVTPFRLRQEAVLTGAILHESGHARHSLWKPLTAADMAANPMLHDDGTPVTKQEFMLAKLMEEPRVEALMARDADSIGAVGLGWTMRAMAAYLLPPTALSMDPAQAVMDIIASWALRAGRQIGINHHTRRYVMPGWVHQFTSLLGMSIQSHLLDLEAKGAVLTSDPAHMSSRILALLTSMIKCEDDHGTSMVDTAREVLFLLFPETGDEETDSQNGEAMPSGSACSAGGDPEPGEAGEREAGEDQPEPVAAPESDEEDSDGSEGQPEDEEPGDDGSAGEETSECMSCGSPDHSMEDCPGAPNAEDSDDSADEDDSASTSSEGEEETETEDKPVDTSSQVAQTLAALEANAKAQVTDEAEDESEQTPPPMDLPGTGAGSGSSGRFGGGWRTPAPEERDVQKGAERFLRDMVDASESSKRTLTDQPSANVDGAALSAWKAGGQVREPHFFVRTRRNVEPAPPIEIAILVDVSASMDDLQKPSALLSWSLAAAALDLRNFAGRGQSVKSCLIHWGDTVRVVQSPGEVLPGIREVACNQGTSNMHGAMDEVARVMPGFFDVPERPVNRLLVQFTDWKLHNEAAALEKIKPALENGVNMLSVVPSNYSYRWASLSNILQACPIQRGTTSLVKYNPNNPGEVWRQAAEALNTATTGQAPAPFEGF